jgi:hypothetical protein
MDQIRRDGDNLGTDKNLKDSRVYTVSLYINLVKLIDKFQLV